MSDVIRTPLAPEDECLCWICCQSAVVQREIGVTFRGDVERRVAALCEECDEREPTYAEALKAQIQKEEG